MRKVIVALVILAAAVGGWWYESPWWTLGQMRDAARAGDAQKLSQYVDYPALREDLKGDLRRSLTMEMVSRKQDGFAMIGSAIAMAMIDPLIDAMVTPEGVQAIFDQRKRVGSSDNKPKIPVASNNPIIDRMGFNEFKVRDKDPKKGALVFKQSGLGWKLSGLDLPANDSTSVNEVQS